MTTLTSLIQALQQKAGGPNSPSAQPLSDAQYSDGFDSISQGAGWSTYHNFIIPQLEQVLMPLLRSRDRISILEVGPGPKSVLGCLPGSQRQKITRYTAFESNELFAMRLESWLGQVPQSSSPLPALETSPLIHRSPFLLDSDTTRSTALKEEQEEKFDLILFCHSMYGMRPQRSIEDEDKTLDNFAAFVTGFSIQDGTTMSQAIQSEWRQVCRDLGRHDNMTHQGKLMYNTPEVMKAFTKHAVALPELIERVPTGGGSALGEGLRHQPAAIVRPTEIQHIQECVRWAVKQSVGLTILYGGHGRQGVSPGVVALDMSAFDQVEIIAPEEETHQDPGYLGDFGSVVIAGAGCTTGDIINNTMKSGLTVPLGLRNRDGAGQWLQGGIGPLARQYGLSCDAIIGAVLVPVDSPGEVRYIGHVPSQHRPAGAVRPDNEADLLWAIKGSGTNVGIVLRLTFRAYAAPGCSIRNWTVPLGKIPEEAASMLREFDVATKALPWNSSADAHVCGDVDKPHLSVTMYEVFTIAEIDADKPSSMHQLLGPENGLRILDGVGLLSSEAYMSDIRSGHRLAAKTSAFERCMFLSYIMSPNIARALLTAVETRPSQDCYLHLLQGGGAVRNAGANTTAFGCRDWHFACVVTGAWPRHQNGTETARAAVRWVYRVVEELLPLSTGAHGASLGPDLRDAALATRAFGPNRPRLARLKRAMDPHNVLAHTCPLLNKAPREPKLIVLVTGQHGADTDHCAGLWACVFNRKRNLKAHVARISDAMMRGYADASGTDLNRLLHDRACQEQHRLALSEFFETQVRKHPQLRENHFMNTVYEAANLEVDVLLITGMEDEAPVAALSHLVSGSRVVEVRVQANRESQEMRRAEPNHGRPTFVFDSDTTGEYKMRIEPFALGGDWAKVDTIVAREPGGSVIAAALAGRVGVPLVLFREEGKQPSPTVSVDKPPPLYPSSAPPAVSASAESSDNDNIARMEKNKSNLGRIEMGRDAVARGASVLVVHNVLASGRCLCAVLELLTREAGIDQAGVSVLVVAEVPARRGRELLRQRGFGGVRVQSLLVLGDS
ncbi:hypothetical protein PG996_015054 [Apiospora saccharicola]|uniref:FAD-binding PCMH-type domain-containing protein n=1 Tax=Apiospora saccharicola TaxID=335842 RepID=A0ABR1TK14_9PEZI